MTSNKFEIINAVRRKLKQRSFKLLPKLDEALEKYKSDHNTTIEEIISEALARFVLPKGTDTSRYITNRANKAEIARELGFENVDFGPERYPMKSYVLEIPEALFYTAMESGSSETEKIVEISKLLTAHFKSQTSSKSFILRKL